MSASARLYTPELLALTLELAKYPLDESLPLQGQARSRSCGSTLALSLACNDAGAIVAVGAKASACAVGQAATALFLKHAHGLSQADVQTAADAMERWIAGGPDVPAWPGIEMLDDARAFPGRHGAMLLPWKAALDALSSNAHSS